MLLHNIYIYIFFFLLFVLRPSLCPCYLIFLLFSFLKIVSFFSIFFFPFLLNFFLCCVRVSSFAMWVQVWWVMPWVWVWVWWVIGIMIMPWVWVCVVVFVGLAMVGHRSHGFMGHAMGFVWWVISIVVMLWVWVALGFIFVVVS